jgi:hypothetical protein
MLRAALKKAVWMILAACLLAAGCGGDVREAVLSIGEGPNLPCLGVRRLKITVFKDEVSGKSLEVFGEFYSGDGSCNLLAGLPVDISGLPYTNKMSILVEGFDSSEKRRMCLGIVDQVTRKQVETGDLEEMTLNREAVDVGGVPTYPTGTLVIPSLPDVESVGRIETLDFILNHHLQEPDKINGSIVAEPSAPLGGSILVLSNVLPTPPTGNNLLVVARNGGMSVGHWTNESAFAVNAGDIFVEVRMAREQ